MPLSTLYNISTKNIAGVVVLYNPEISVLDNIHTYLHQVDHLFIYDNSERNNARLHISYLYQQQNKGIAAALNAGAEAALKRGYQWLLTMDQDSAADLQMIHKLADYINTQPENTLGIVAPLHIDKNTIKSSFVPPVQDELTVMTSGNLLSLRAFENTGKFMEKLFIDYVDHEYCLRLRQKGYTIIQVNDALLYHNLGNIASVKIGNRKIHYSNHSALRRYYMTRNRVYVMSNYRRDFPSFYTKELLSMWKEIVKILLFEDQKFRKMKSVIKGIVHFKQGRFGKL
jgi:rhamnosyltransferase